MIHRPRSLWIIFKIGMYFWPDSLQFFKAQLSHAQGRLCNEKQVESSVTICSFHMFFWNRILELPLAKPSWSVKFPGSRFLSTQIRKYNLGNLATSLVFRRWSPSLTLILRRQLSDSFSAFYNLAVSLHYNKVFIIKILKRKISLKNYYDHWTMWLTNIPVYAFSLQLRNC